MLLIDNGVSTTGVNWFCVAASTQEAPEVICQRGALHTPIDSSRLNCRVLDHAASHGNSLELGGETARHYERPTNGEYREWLPTEISRADALVKR